MPDLVGPSWCTKSRVTEVGLPRGFKIVLDHKCATAAAPSPAAPAAIPHLFDKSDAGAFTVCAETLLREEKSVVLIGTGLNLLFWPLLPNQVGRTVRNVGRASARRSRGRG